MAHLIKSRHNRGMPKQVSPSELDAILEVIRQFPGGVSIDQLVDDSQLELPRRTLQRRLAALVTNQRLQRSGRGPATRYRVPATHTETITDGLKTSVSLVSATLVTVISPEGDEVRKLVQQPIELRHPVGYQRQFLDKYRPNETFYLTAEVRRQLMELGQSIGEWPAGTYARQVLNRLLIDLSWNSSRLEGNTYSLLDTERLIQLGEAAEQKDAAEAQMILNHKAAIELLVDQAAEIGCNRYTILNLHALLSDNLLGDPEAGGRLRFGAVGVAGTVYHPLESPQLLEGCFDQILETAAAIQDPFEQSFFMMVQLPYLQPFIDVNKRVSRLAANIPFIQKNLCPLSFVDVPRQTYIEAILGVYELNRVELLRDLFVWAYERSTAKYSAIRQSLGEPDPFRRHYRQQLTEVVREIVLMPVARKVVSSFISKFAEGRVVDQDKARFLEIVETEVISLHEGNIARHRIRPSEYRRWREGWL
jgi:hypothetical protein